MGSTAPLIEPGSDTLMPDHKVPVPVSATEVRSFLESERERFLRDLKDITTLVTQSLRGENTYKIYGRSEKQRGEITKHPRKIRMKFNKYFLENKMLTGSLWSVPDIIGFTIVVQYPSDISRICAIIDSLISDRRLIASERVVPTTQTKRPEIAIASIFGRAIEYGGYFACHYNVRKPGVDSARPICEIQIKTVLHDAWGGKSHDLTYKPSGQTSQELLDSFNLLGDALAKIDQQSDLIRRSIERTASVRERKKRALQAALLGEVARAIVNTSSDLKDLAAEIESISIGKYLDSDIDKWTGKLIQVFETDKRSACILLCLLANRSETTRTLEQAQETIDFWFEQESDLLMRAYIKSVSALASYSGGNLAEAIEASEHGVEIAEKIDRSNLKDDQHHRLDRVLNSLLTSLAYYHADRIGSHEGNLGGSAALAQECLQKSVPIRTRLGMLPEGLDSSDEQIKSAFADPVYGWPSFSTLDNEAFVKIQTAKTETQLRSVRERMDFIHKNGPPQRSGTTQLLFDYHDYCARARLAELESD